MSFSNLDQLYRKSFENKRVTPTNTSWNDVERLLQNSSPEKKIRFKLRVLVFSLITLMCSLLLFVMWKPETKPENQQNIKFPTKPYELPKKKNDLYASSGKKTVTPVVNKRILPWNGSKNASEKKENGPLPDKTESPQSLVLAEDHQELKPDNNMHHLQQTAAIEHQVSINPELRFKKLNITVKQDMLLADIPEPLYEENNFQEETGLPTKVFKTLQERATQLYITASERNIIHQ